MQKYSKKQARRQIKVLATWQVKNKLEISQKQVGNNSKTVENYYSKYMSKDIQWPKKVSRDLQIFPLNPI